MHSLKEQEKLLNYLQLSLNVIVGDIVCMQVQHQLQIRGFEQNRNKKFHHQSNQGGTVLLQEQTLKGKLL
jgi:hypothetical protein